MHFTGRHTGVRRGRRKGRKRRRGGEGWEKGINTGAVQNPKIVSQRSIPKIFKDKKGGIRGRFGRWKRSDDCENGGEAGRWYKGTSQPSERTGEKG